MWYNVVQKGSNGSSGHLLLALLIPGAMGRDMTRVEPSKAWDPQADWPLDLFKSKAEVAVSKLHMNWH